MKKSILFAFLFIMGAFVVACGSTSSVTSNEEGSADTNTETTDEVAEFTPEGPIKYIVGFAPGGGTDLAARSAARTLNEEGIVEESFAVENITGGGGVRALMELRNKGDENTLLQSVDIYAGMYMPDANMRLDDFIPVAQIANNTLLMVVPSDSEYQTVDELMNAMKDDSKQIFIGLPSATDTVEVAKWNEIAESYGIESELRFIPHNGISEVVPELLGGRIDVALFVPPVIKGYLDSDELNALATLSTERLEVLPEIPTLVEQGSDVYFYRPQGVFMKAGISEEAVSYWENALKEMTMTDSWKEYIESQLYIDEFKGRDEYTEWMDTEGRRYSEFLNSQN
ncbi:tripartite tricarboxylate transporter substrate binding protein [Alkalihalophilus lindianensis]|uniref:Tripartite tricarboxylate transporter substrate binding protein n=1 Tax=Alkalihalophilus lindianensis TaxID=1630542 RepID=A0ABU3XCH9_9BACI|nr:tripartite tricarboxylate transporter substrate binding protein [Alkalihalophilus lindianensis]MDV2685591.1 tripartite tricarboxylate transporter substrate binding protein [Alkalihalophilus lindianensis]